MIFSGPEPSPDALVHAVHQPLDEGLGLLGVTEAEQRVDREGCVADPRVAVVPVALAADLLGQARRRRGHERTGRRVGHELERHRRAGDHLAPAPPVGRAIVPVAPESPWSRGASRSSRRARSALGSAPPVSSMTPVISPALRLPVTRNPSAVEFDLTRALGAVEHRVADAMHGERLVVGDEHRAVAVGGHDRVRRPAVVESRLDLGGERHRAAHDAKHPHQSVAVGRLVSGDRA